MTAPSPHPRAVALASAGLVLGACLCIQLSAAIAADLFDTVGTLGVSALRMAVAAVVLLVLVRPTLRGRSRRGWAGIVLYGVAMAAMNVLFYGAVHHLPLGLAVTLEFLGPFTVAVLGTRSRSAALWTLTALGGVALVSDPTGGMNLTGMLFGLGAAAAFGSYTLLAGVVGRASAGFAGLALSVTVSALALLPFSALTAPRVTATQWPQLAASGVIGVAIAYSLTFVASRISPPRLIGTLLTADPAMGALVGAVVLQQALSTTAAAGIVAVVASGAAVTWLASRPPQQDPAPGNAGGRVADVTAPSSGQVGSKRRRAG